MSKKKYLAYPLILLVSIVIWFMSPDVPGSQSGEQIFKAGVLEVLSEETVEDLDGNALVQELELQIESGSFKGEKIQLTNDNSLATSEKQYRVNDQVVLVRNYSQSGPGFFISGYYRANILGWLLALFLVVVLGVTGKQGLGSLLGLGVSFVVIFKFVIPQILLGMSPLFAAILGAIFIIPATFYSSHGFNKKTSIAVLGTLISLVLTGFLADYFAGLAHISGLAGEEAAALKIGHPSLDFRGIILAGMIISVLGILDDITISQSSVVHEIRQAKPHIKFQELFKRAMNVGKDHIASMVNTLILVYAGAYLPLLLVLYTINQGFFEAINYESISEEAIRTLVGSIGLILAVPLTSLLACLSNPSK